MQFSKVQIQTFKTSGSIEGVNNGKMFWQVFLRVSSTSKRVFLTRLRKDGTAADGKKDITNEFTAAMLEYLEDYDNYIEIKDNKGNVYEITLKKIKEGKK